MLGRVVEYSDCVWLSNLAERRIGDVQVPDEERPADEPSLREEFVHLLNTRVRIVLSVAIDALMLLLILPVLWILEWVRDRLQVHGFNAWFLTAVEVLTTLVTLYTVVLILIADIRLAHRRLRSARQEERHDHA